MNEIMLDAVLFDFDGVIADTESVFATFDCRLLNEVLEQAGRPEDLTPGEIRQLAGAGSGDKKLQIISERKGFDPAPFMEAFLEKRGHLRKTLFRDEKAYLARGLTGFFTHFPGRYALATNKRLHKVQNDIANMGLGAYLDPVIFACEPPLRPKPEPDILLAAAKALDCDPARMAYVGDNVLDIEAARNAGMLPVGFIIEGLPHSRSAILEKAGAAAIIDDMAWLADRMATR